MTVANWSPWKLVTIGIAVLISTVLVTGLVVANWSPRPQPPADPQAVAQRPVAEPARPPIRHQGTRPAAVRPQGPSAADVLQKALIGGALGAGVGAAGGAIAGGGSGAGKGAAIGGIVGATAGTLFGLNHR